jgi:predicted NACHT family NTPase
MEEESRKEQVFDADDIAKKFDKVVIVGAPGSGKTTFLRHLALKFCIENLEKQEKTILPVFITLKGYMTIPGTRYTMTIILNLFTWTELKSG